MPATRLEYLFDRYLHNSCTREEEEEFMTLMSQPAQEAELRTLLDNVIENTGTEMRIPDQTAASILQNILHKNKRVVPFINKKKASLVFYMRVAATVILFLAAAGYLFLNRKDNLKTKLAVKPQHLSPVLPGGNRAALTMSDGSTIILDSVQNGTLHQGGTRINKQSGLLVYNAPSASSGAQMVYNTLSTPRGGQYQVILPDGSKVWLNAASSLRFPTAFNGKIREVELTGEGYFEAAKNKEKPFQVKVGNMRINVLGTHFNVNAYADESEVKTSLLEGSVRITEDGISDLLKPGQQGIVNRKEGKIKITDANMSEAIAWKNGLFQFEGADVTALMRQIGRWYDMEIVYARKPQARTFCGKITRTAQLSQVLQILEFFNLEFSVEGKRIIVR